MIMTPSQATQVCESVLREELEYNQARSIWPSVNRIIERMLARSIELRDAYQELHEALAHCPRGLHVFFDVFTYTPVGWSSEKISEARQARKELAEVNDRIASMANELACLLARRDEIQENSSFSTQTFYHVLDVLSAASEGNYLFEHYVEESLQALQYQYDLKYWPLLSEFVGAIAADAESAEIIALDPATAAATASRRSGLSNFLKAFFVRLKENTGIGNDGIPKNFRISDSALASLINVALDLGVNDLVDGDFVKRFRQREREKKSV